MAILISYNGLSTVANNLIFALFCCAKLSLQIFITVLSQNNINQLKEISSNLIRLPSFFRYLMRNPSEKVDLSMYWCWMVFAHTKSFKLEVVHHSTFYLNAMLQTFFKLFWLFSLFFPVFLVVHSLHIVARTNRHYKRVKCYSMRWTVREQARTCDVPHDGRHFNQLSYEFATIYRVFQLQCYNSSTLNNATDKQLPVGDLTLFFNLSSNVNILWIRHFQYEMVANFVKWKTPIFYVMWFSCKHSFKTFLF